MKKWACVACDQYSSQPEYWDAVSELVGEEPSTYHVTFPEVYLGRVNTEERIQNIHDTMDRYLEEGLFHTYRRSFVYLERAMADGSIRRGLVGQVDLEDYDFSPGSGAMIRATEGTVKERIPPRMRMLEGASLEFPHVLMLCNDKKDAILRTAQSVCGDEVYDFDLMGGGGHITGWVISGLGVSVVNAAVSEYIAASKEGQATADVMAFAVGDGNHSLATAKACWEALKPALTEERLAEHPARYALVELVNIHDPAIEFEAIHRVVQGAPAEELIGELRARQAPDGHPVTVVTEAGEQTIYLDRALSPLPIAIVQPILDRYQEKYGAEMDYIHGANVVRKLSATPDTVGLIFPGMEKSALFPGVIQGGVLPRKTFSMGAAQEKRYYLEGKKRK